MTPEEVLEASASLHRSWVEKVSEQVPVVPSHAKPGKTDYNEHHADRSATAEQEDGFNGELMKVIRKYQESP